MGLQLWLLGTRAAAAVRQQQQQQQQQPAVRGTISAAIYVCAPGIRPLLEVLPTFSAYAMEEPLGDKALGDTAALHEKCMASLNSALG